MKSFFVICGVAALSQAQTLTTYLGVAESLKKPEGKLLLLVYEEPLSYGFGLRVTGGTLHRGNLISDKIHWQTGTELGLRVTAVPGLQLAFYQGVSVHTNTFRGLASRWQLPTTVEVLLGEDRAKLGLFVRHYSNGTRSSRNTGINHIGVALSYRL